MNATVALISSNDPTRQAIARAISTTSAKVVRQFSEYPQAVSNVLASGCDIVLVDLDEDLERGLEIIEQVSRRPDATAIACSSRNEADIVIHAMRAGSREFLVPPFDAATLRKAFERAAVRRESAAPERPLGRLIVFHGSKGGVGVTTLACNFAVALARESAGQVLLVDMHPQLGEVALHLGMTAEFSITDALENTLRLDADFLSSLLARHESGLMVLASPDTYGVSQLIERGADRLLRILREEFDFVVVDAGACCGNFPEALLDLADNVYLVTEISLAALRNARRMISWFSDKRNIGNLKVVLNRYNSRMIGIDEKSAIKALSRSIDWRIPNDYDAVRRAQNVGVPLVNQQTPVAKVVCQMARDTSGNQTQAHEKETRTSTQNDKWKFWRPASNKLSHS